MKSGSLLKKIIYSSWFLAVIPAILIILTLPPLGSRYKLLVEEVDKSFIFDFYTDLNSDGISEIVRQGRGIPYYYLVVLDNDQ